MDRSIIQALGSLVPSLSGSLPPELLELAVSLLAQSRSKASSLKADEEIARAYACANIACERLKQNLGLPKIQPRPPCPPKIYQKLYKYLDGALPIGTRKSARATRPIGTVSTPGSSPAKQRTPAKAAHTKPDTPKRRAPHKEIHRAPDVPSWLMPAIRRLCKRMATPAAPHHVFAGVSSIILSQDLSQAEEINLPALIIAVYLLVTTRLSGVKTQPAEYLQKKSLALQILKESAGEDAKRKEVDDVDVDECTKQFSNRGWTHMDWFGNIPVGAGVGNGDGFVEEDVDQVSSDDGGEKEQLLPAFRKDDGILGSYNEEYLQAGLGTMMQERVDYLSDDRRREYQKWKRDILSRIDELERREEMGSEAG